MLSAAWRYVSGLFGGWMVYALLVLVATNGFTYAMWKDASKEVLAFEIAGKAAKEEKERIETQHNQTLKEVTDAWDRYSKDSKRNAIAAYDAKYGRTNCLQPGSVQVPVPGHADSTEALHGREPKRRVCTEEFIKTCVDDAAFRISVRSWVFRNNLRVDD